MQPNVLVGHVWEETEVDTDQGGNNKGATGRELAPNEADILISHATVPGFVSYRSHAQGSFYITALCESLLELRSRYVLTIIHFTPPHLIILVLFCYANIRFLRLQYK